MGCDIHALIEQKDEKYDWSYWINRGNPEIDRNYTIFSILANVRNGNDIPFIAEHRGVDENSCYEFKAWHSSENGDAHSTSWVTLKEMQEYSRKRDSDCLDELIGKLASFGGRPEDIRIVFFFDN